VMRVLTGVIIILNERQLLIFQSIIDDFIETAQPVGSKVIANKSNISVSAATIRSVMADLEKMGYLEKTHSSSGRVPSQKGYRYYVDHLINPVQRKDMNIIKNLIEDGIFEFEQIVQTSAEILSDLTNYTAIILGPEIYEAKLIKMEIVKLSESTAVAVLITDTGHVEHRSFTLPPTISASDLEKMVNILNEKLNGVAISRLSDQLNNELVDLLRRYIRDVDQSYDYLKEVLFNEEPIKLYVGGKSNMLTQPEFNDVEKIHSFYSLMENEDQIAKLFKQTNEGIKVTIGDENALEAMKDFTLITSTYALNDEQLGTIALLGPTRMHYDKVIQLLNSLSSEMSEVLYLWYKNKK